MQRVRPVNGYHEPKLKKGHGPFGPFPVKVKRRIRPKRPPGRPPGTPNRTHKLLKEAILYAAECLGEDGCGLDGLVGYLKDLARTEKKVFGMLLGKVLPLQIIGDKNRPLRLIVEGQSLKEATEAYQDTVAQIGYQPANIVEGEFEEIAQDADIKV